MYPMMHIMVLSMLRINISGLWHKSTGDRYLWQSAAVTRYIYDDKSPSMFFRWSVLRDSAVRRTGHNKALVLFSIDTHPRSIPVKPGFNRAVAIPHVYFKNPNAHLVWFRDESGQLQSIFSVLLGAGGCHFLHYLMFSRAEGLPVLSHTFIKEVNVEFDPRFLCNTLERNRGLTRKI